MATILNLIPSGSPQTITGSEVQIGTVVLNNVDYSYDGLYIDLDINDSKNVEIIPYGRLTTTGDDYRLPYVINRHNFTSVRKLRRRIDDNEDQKIIVPFDTFGLAPYIIFKVLAGTVGASAGRILEANVINFYQQ